MITQNQYMLAEHTLSLGYQYAAFKQRVNVEDRYIEQCVSFISPEHYSCHFMSLLIQVSSQ